jgi:hypothetical protein
MNLFSLTTSFPMAILVAWRAPVVRDIGLGAGS